MNTRTRWLIGSSLFISRCQFLGMSENKNESLKILKYFSNLKFHFFLKTDLITAIASINHTTLFIIGKLYDLHNLYQPISNEDYCSEKDNEMGWFSEFDAHSGSRIRKICGVHALIFAIFNSESLNRRERKKASELVDTNLISNGSGKQKWIVGLRDLRRNRRSRQE